MKFKTQRRVSHVLETDDGIELQLDHEPCNYREALLHRDGDTIIAAYLVQDEGCENPLDNCDGMGKIIGRGRYQTRNQGGESEFYEAFGLDSYGDKDYGLVEDQVNKAWIEYVESLDSGFWSAVLDALGYPTPSACDDKAMDAAGEYMNKLRDGLTEFDISSPGYEVFDALNDVESYITDYDASRAEISAASQLFQFDAEKVREDCFNEAIRAGDIGNRFAVLLDVYDHSGIAWSISGGGMQCRWDTSSGAGLWLPDSICEDEITRRAKVYATYWIENTSRLRGRDKKYQLLCMKDGKSESIAFSDDWSHLWKMAQTSSEGLTITPEMLRKGEIRAMYELAGQALEQYNAWLSGDCYGCVMQRFQRQEDDSWESVEDDACWGFVGSDYAEEVLKVEFFDPHVKAIETQASTPV